MNENNPLMVKLSPEVLEIKKETIDLRREFHRFPELGFEEKRTASVVSEKLKRLGLEVKTGIGGTGVVGLLRGTKTGKTLLIRADMDALPVHEENKVDYCSQVPGKMHACGHDGHTAMLLSAAKVLSNCRDKIHGTLKFIFQPAEETIEGAPRMIYDKVLENPKVDAAIGLHLWNVFPIGTAGVAAGVQMAAADKFQIVVKGKGGHGAVPHLAIDPVPVACQIVSALQTIVSREINSLNAVVVTVGLISGGTAFNVIPNEVKLIGTVRTLDELVRQAIPGIMERIIKGITSALRADYHFQYTLGCPTLRNDEKMTAIIRKVAENIVGQQNVLSPQPIMGSEDMAFFLDKVPGCFIWLGSANTQAGLNQPHHNSRFDFDEEALPIGIELLKESALSYLSE